MANNTIPGQPTQRGNLISIDTPLGPDAFVVIHLHGHEALSSLYSFDVKLVSLRDDVKPAELIGKQVSLSIALRDSTQQVRRIHGHVANFAIAPNDGAHLIYDLKIVPWLWFLDKTKNSRVYEGTPRDILTKIFEEHGFRDFKFQLSGNYPTSDFCVQYQESDFAFVSRLMEHYGIFYFFTHEEKKHTLVCADSVSAHAPCPGQNVARYRTDPYQSGAAGKGGVVHALHFSQSVPPSQHSVLDYDYEKAQQRLEVTVPGKTKLNETQHCEEFEYPGKFREISHGELLAKVRMERSSVEHISIHGVATCPAFLPGYRFDLIENPRKDLNRAYVLTSVMHTASGSHAGHVEKYDCQFDCIPSDVPFRPPLDTPRPVMAGPHTAIVVGKSDQEIFTDPKGLNRVKVQFHWDRKGKHDESSSCWVRVAQPFAGRGWGAQFTPRIGQEVLVNFIDGDPDRPIIVGGLYNSVELPPYGANDASKSTLRTNTTKGGGGFNELRFEDKKDAEQIFIHAQRDLDLRVKGARRESIGGDAHRQIGGDHNEETKKSVYVKAGDKVVIDAGAELTIRVGDNYIKIDKGSVVIQGKMVYINTDGHEPGSIPDAPKAADSGTKPGSVDAKPPKKG